MASVMAFVVASVILGWNIPPDKWPLYMDGVFKTTNRAIQGGCHDTQVLGFLAPHLHLISHGWFFGGANATLGMIDEIRLAHFLRHYLETLGVMPGNMHLFVPFGTDVARVSRLVPQGTDVRVIARNDTRHSVEQRNEFIRELPVGAWIMTPEPDEFYHFPCRQIKHFNVEHLVKRGYDVFCGGMEDMVPANGLLAPMLPSPDLQEQFPRRCRIRTVIKGACSSVIRATLYLSLDLDLDLDLRSQPISPNLGLRPVLSPSSHAGFNTFKILLARAHAGCPGQPQTTVRQFKTVHALEHTTASASALDCHNNGALGQGSSLLRGLGMCGYNSSEATPMISNNPGPPVSTRFRVGPFAHYTYTSERMAETLHAIEQHREEFLKNASASWSRSCVHRLYNKGRCMDYELIKNMMVTIHNVSASGNWVHTNLCQPASIPH